MSAQNVQGMVSESGVPHLSHLETGFNDFAAQDEGEFSYLCLLCFCLYCFSFGCELFS